MSPFVKEILAADQSCVFFSVSSSLTGNETLDGLSVLVRSHLCSLVGNAALTSTGLCGNTVLGQCTDVKVFESLRCPLEAPAIFPTLINKLINAIYTASDCFSGFWHPWTNLMLEHQSCLSLPVHAAAEGCVIVRQANGMENAASEVSLWKQFIPFSAKDTSKCQRFSRANGEIRTWKRLLPSITGMEFRFFNWFMCHSASLLKCNKYILRWLNIWI